MIYIIAIIILILTFLYFYQGKNVIIRESKNKEFFYSINPDDHILREPELKYACSQYRRKDLQNITSMDIIR
jgi:hypothetical protein